MPFSQMCKVRPGSSPALAQGHTSETELPVPGGMQTEVEGPLWGQSGDTVGS